MGKLGNLKIIAAAVIFFTFSDISFSAVQPTGVRNPRYQTREEKLQQLQQESTTAVTDIDANYTKIIGYVNAGQTPAPDELKGLQKGIMKNKKYLLVLDDSQKSVYHILSAWVSYFDQKNDRALKQAETGQKVFAQNLNAVKTRLALSLLCKDYSAMMASLTETASQKPARRIPQTTQTGMDGMPGAQGMPGIPGASSYTSTASTATGELMLDVNTVRIELIGKTFDSNLSPLDSSLPSWRSSGRLLCAILWKIDSAELDDFAPVVPKKIEPNEPNIPAPAVVQEQAAPAQPQGQAQSQPSGGGGSPVISPGVGGVAPVNPNYLEDMSHPDSAPAAPATQQPQQTAEPVQEQIPPPQPMPMYEAAPSEQMQPVIMPQGQPLADGQTKQTTAFNDFYKLQTIFAKDKRTAFAAINFNDQTKKANIINWLKKNPQKWQTVFPASEQSVLSPVSENLVDEPILLIVAPDSTIRYAGRADGFLPQMIIDSILNSPADVNKVDANLPAVEYKQPAVEQEPNRQPAEQAAVLPPVSQDANSTTQIAAQPAPVPAATTKQDDDFFDPRAEQLLSTATQFFKIGNRLQFHTYAKPVEMCRTVMKDYPNTKYATQAQVLLRQVPERFRARFNLTDQELGL